MARAVFINRGQIGKDVEDGRVRYGANVKRGGVIFDKSGSSASHRIFGINRIPPLPKFRREYPRLK